MKTNGKNNCFTLIELLIVTAVIAILVSLLLPALNKARNSAKLTDCASKEKDIGICVFMYSGDYNMYFPGSWQSWTGWWKNSLDPYIGSEKDDRWDCPSGANNEQLTVGGVLYPHGTSRSYAANAFYFAYADWTAWRKIGYSQTPSCKVGFYDSKYSGASYDPVGYTVNRCATIRHGNKLNALFLDGHVKTVFINDIIANNNDIMGKNSP